MAEKPELETQDVATPTKINRKPPRKLREFEGRSVADPLPRAKRYKRALLAVHKPSYCLKRGIGSLQCGGQSLRFQHRARLFRLLNQLLSRHNWAEASGVLSVLIQGTIKDRSLSGNRAKYTVKWFLFPRKNWNRAAAAVYTWEFLFTNMQLLIIVWFLSLPHFLIL